MVTSKVNASCYLMEQGKTEFDCNPDLPGIVIKGEKEFFGFLA